MKSFKTLVKLTDSEYNNLVISGFTVWCGHFALTPTEMQLMLINGKLFRWYVREFKRTERRFLQLKGVKSINIKRSLLLSMITRDIYSIKTYPKPIINDIRRKINKATKNKPDKPLTKAFMGGQIYFN